ncbi:MAG: TldD/PmbA family protein [Spirochaetes bacterium]|nr:TldD/PmbA family protein [Spirochaetota bacterium]
MKDYLYRALNLAKLNGASYADIRIIETTGEWIKVKNGLVDNYKYYTKLGFGVRVIVNGGWGFAASSVLNEEEIDRITKYACQIAKSSSYLRNKYVELAYEPPYNDVWQTLIQVDPFKVSFDKKLGLLLEVDKILRKDEKIKIAEGTLGFEKEIKYFANSEGSMIKQTFFVSGGGYSATAIEGGIVQRRSYPQSFEGQFCQGGWEIIEGLKFLENAERIREEAVSLLTAKDLPYGRRDLIIGGSQLALQIHESCGHPSELDRVLGMEENYAGSSFLKTNIFKNFHYGSNIVNIVADSTLPNGLGTFGYDDDGVRAQRWFLVKDGLYQNYLTNREFCHYAGYERSFGCNRADSFSSIPIIRMVNISLLPGDKEFDEIISATDDGVYVDGVKTWSIDQMRLNFQFTCEIGYVIKNGKIKEVVKNPTYQGITPEFWQSCDMIANENHWVGWGVMNCGKGQPAQIMRMTHGASPARFKNIISGVSYK